jgi:hypothetical protein
MMFGRFCLEDRLAGKGMYRAILEAPSTQPHLAEPRSDLSSPMFRQAAQLPFAMRPTSYKCTYRRLGRSSTPPDLALPILLHIHELGLAIVVDISLPHVRNGDFFVGKDLDISLC